MSSLERVGKYKLTMSLDEKRKIIEKCLNVLPHPLFVPRKGYPAFAGMVIFLLLHYEPPPAGGASHLDMSVISFGVLARPRNGSLNAFSREGKRQHGAFASARTLSFRGWR